MNLQDLIYNLTQSKDSPLSDEQKSQLTEEYFKEMSSLKNEIRTLNEQNEKYKGRIGDLEFLFNAIKKDSIACLTSVKAMLELSTNGNATHSDRNFYNRSMIKYMEVVIKKIDNESCDEGFPF
jgi:hypothetical protein